MSDDRASDSEWCRQPDLDKFWIHLCLTIYPVLARWTVQQILKRPNVFHVVLLCIFRLVHLVLQYLAPLWRYRVPNSEKSKICIHCSVDGFGYISHQSRLVSENGQTYSKKLKINFLKYAHRHMLFALLESAYSNNQTYKVSMSTGNLENLMIKVGSADSGTLKFLSIPKV